MVLVAALFFVGFGMIGAAAKQASQTPGVTALFIGLGAVGGVVFLIFGAVPLVIGIGLWRLCGWARIITIALSALSLLITLPGLLLSLISFRVLFLLFQLVVAGIYALIIWYMLQPHVKRAFGAA